METKTDPLAKVLANHIWYTTRAGSTGSPIVMCLCRARLRDTDEHAEHLASIARRYLEREWSAS